MRDKWGKASGVRSTELDHQQGVLEFGVRRQRIGPFVKACQSPDVTDQAQRSRDPSGNLLPRFSSFRLSSLSKAKNVAKRDQIRVQREEIIKNATAELKSIPEVAFQRCFEQLSVFNILLEIFCLKYIIFLVKISTRVSVFTTHVSLHLCLIFKFIFVNFFQSVVVPLSCFQNRVFKASVKIPHSALSLVN